MSQDDRRLSFSTQISGQATLVSFWRAWLPLGTAFVVLVLHYIDRKLTWRLLFEEGTGLFEILHVVIPLITTIVALRMFFALPSATVAGLRVWVALLALGCFYIAGEELSWGQHLFGWETPEGWAEINRQQETNLHNTSSWLNHKPRVLLNIWVLIGSVLVPICLMRGWATDLINRFQFVLPSRAGHVMGWLVLFYMTWDSFRKDGYLPFISPRDAEMHELFLYSYLLIYAITLRTRVQQWKAAT